MALNLKSIYHPPNISSESAIEEWLLHEGSLTEKLKEKSGEAKLHLVSQNWCKPNWWDKYLLKVTHGLVWERVILMYSKQTPYWYARSVIPQNCYSLNRNFFDRLQTESIRDLIFDEPS